MQQHARYQLTKNAMENNRVHKNAIEYDGTRYNAMHFSARSLNTLKHRRQYDAINGDGILMEYYRMLWSRYNSTQ